MTQRFLKILTISALAVGISACDGSDDDTDQNLTTSDIPQLTAATSATVVQACTELSANLDQLSNTEITAVTEAAAGELSVAGEDVPAHCVVTGKMFERVSEVDGNTYAISFEMRLPLEWNGRFFHQGNGGIDGSVTTATGSGGPGGLTNALHQGFAVLSSDAGHSGNLGPTFGIDPVASLH